MTRATINFKKSTIALLGLFASTASLAAPQRCQPGYQDSSCARVLLPRCLDAALCAIGVLKAGPHAK